MEKVKKEAASENIQEVARLYQSYILESKKLAKSAEALKEKLLAHAKENDDLFDDNKLSFECGTYIQRRLKMETVYDTIEDWEWIETIYEIDCQEIIKIELDSKKVQHALETGDKKTKKALGVALDEINYHEEEKEVLAVYA